jgi:hypothetical protein
MSVILILDWQIIAYVIYAEYKARIVNSFTCVLLLHQLGILIKASTD